MNVHENARTTPRSRACLVERVRCRGWTVAQAAAAAGISERTAYKWLGRFKEAGVHGLRDRSCRAHCRPHALSPEWCGLLLFMRGFRLPAQFIAEQLGMPISTVSAVFARNGVGPVAALEPPKPPNRYERRQAGDLLHLDIKKLARFRRPGHRVTGSRARQSKGAGWEFVHVAIDDFSRLAYVEILPDERGSTCAAFTRRACEWFARHGITIKALLTDNGTGYRSHRLPASGLAPPSNAPVHAPHKRQGRALHQDAPARMGLLPPLPLQRLAREAIAALASLLQSGETPC